MAAANDIADRVRKVIAEVICIETEKIVDTADLRGDLGLDSLDDVEVVMELETEFAVEFSDDELLGVETVADLVKIVRGRIG